MSFDVGKQALDFLIANSGARRNLEVDFFGGEPLMNWQVVKDLVAYARTQEEPHNKHFRFTLTTNGMLIDDDVIDFANREMDNVVLSLDGARKFTTVCGWITPGGAAMTGSSPSSRSWWRPGETRATTCAAPSPMQIRTSPRTYSTWPTWASGS